MTYFPCSPIEIRDGTFDRLKTISGITNLYKARTKPIKEDATGIQVIVFYGGSETTPAGDANCGEPKFYHKAHISIEVIASANGEQSLDNDVVAMIEQIKMTLLRDTTWVELFEGISKFDDAIEYPKDNTEYYLARGIITIEVEFQSAWDPLSPNDFDSVLVRTKHGQETYDSPIYTEFDLPK